MPLSGRQLVEMSLEMWTRQEANELDEKYNRLADHYNNDLEGATYFPKYFRESQERYSKRPKEVLPLSSATVDALAGAMVGDGVQVTIGESDSKENETYQKIQQHNDLDGYNALAVAQVAGVYGWSADRILLQDKDTIEFERVTPLHFRPIYDNSAIGRSVKRVNGISFSTYYDPDSGSSVPRDTSVGATSRDVKIEIITESEWWVFLNGKPQPTAPMDESVRWMPRDDGGNPYGTIPVSLLWNTHNVSQFHGRADIDPGYKLAEEINRVYSQMLYNLQMLFPTLTIPKQGQGGSGLAMGLGIAVEYPLDGQSPSWISPPFDVANFMEPLKALLTLFFSTVHTPASAHGLGTIFGQQTQESGKAKFYEMGAMSNHVTRKRTNFTSYKRQQWRQLATVLNQAAPYGWGSSLDVDAPVNVEYPTSVVPVSDQEFQEDIISQMQSKLISHIEAILLSRGWQDDEAHREKAQNVLDEIGAAATSTAPKSALDRMLEGVPGGTV